MTHGAVMHLAGDGISPEKAQCDAQTTAHKLSPIQTEVRFTLRQSPSCEPFDQPASPKNRDDFRINLDFFVVVVFY